jgi:hypothetical protein
MACLAAGVLYRLFPIVAGETALTRFFVTEDGYLMLTVARNLAIGNGLTVSDGTIATNGFQPLATFLFALPYWATDGDKLTSLVGVHLLSALIAIAAAWRVHVLARDTLSAQDPDRFWPWLAATFWFIGPLLLLHSMNALETGLYTLTVVTSVWYFGRLTSRPGEGGLRQLVVLGSLFGITFLARNDAAFLVFALLSVRFVHDLASGRAGFRAAIVEAFVPGVVSLVWASPWLIYNHALFGSIVPISGTAQALDTALGASVPYLPARLFETMFPMLPIPRPLETTPIAVLAGLAVVAVLARFLWLQRRGPFRLALFGYALFGLLLAGYYGLFSGATHFLGRYLAPLAPLLITAAVSVGLDLARRAGPRRGRTVARAAGLAGVALSAALLGRLLIPGVHQHEHFQVVAWVQENLAPGTWVGAVQTGTLGYWHDRTINLDGKVNPHALRARIDEGNVLAYVVDSPIACLADWSGILSWARREAGGFSDTFAPVVNDPARNLGVLCRRGMEVGAGRVSAN